MPLNKPSFVTPNRGTADALYTWQQTINNIRERFRNIEAEIVLLQRTSTLLASLGTDVSSLRRQVNRLQVQVDALQSSVQQLLNLFSLAESFEDGDIWVYREEFGQFVPEQPESGAGGVLPVVTGEILDEQPVFVFLEDGSLVYSPVEA